MLISASLIYAVHAFNFVWNKLISDEEFASEMLHFALWNLCWNVLVFFVHLVYFSCYLVIPITLYWSCNQLGGLSKTSVLYNGSKPKIVHILRCLPSMEVLENLT